MPLNALDEVQKLKGPRRKNSLSLSGDGHIHLVEDTAQGSLV